MRSRCARGSPIASATARDTSPTTSGQITGGDYGDGLTRQSGLATGSWAILNPSGPGVITNYPVGGPGPCFFPDLQFPAVGGIVYSLTEPGAGAPMGWDPYHLDWAQGYVGAHATASIGRSGMNTIEQELVLAHPLQVLSWIVVQVIDTNLQWPFTKGRQFFKGGTVVKEDTYANCVAYIDATYP